MTNIKFNNNGYQVTVTANKKLYFVSRAATNPAVIDCRGNDAVKIAYIPVYNKEALNRDYTTYMAVFVKMEGNKFVRIDNKADFHFYNNAKEVDSFWTKNKFGAYILPKEFVQVESNQLF